MPGVFGSESITAPVSGLIRMFCPASLTTRMRSATGSKAKPNAAPLSGTAKVPVPTAVAAPLVGLTT